MGSVGPGIGSGPRGRPAGAENQVVT